MTKLTFLPHPEICPRGKVIEAAPGTSILDAALDHGIPIEHACEKACACTTCHVIVRDGFASLEQATREFAARRMDAGIRRALAGHRPEEFGPDAPKGSGG